MRNADYKNLNLSQRSINRRLDDMAEDIELLSVLIRMFIADPSDIRQKLMDAVKPEQADAVPTNYQNQWLANIQQDKLRKLVAQLQQRQRNQAARKVSKQDIERAFVVANHLQQ